MKNKIKALLFVLCLSVALVSLVLPLGADAEKGAPTIDMEALGTYSYVVYANTDDYEADLSDGKIDGKRDGETCFVKNLSGTSSELSLSNRGEYYVLALRDLSFSENSFKLGTDQKLTLDLGGNSLTLTGSFDLGGWSVLRKNTELTIKNGELLMARESSAQPFACRIGSSLTFINLVIKRTENADYTAFIQDEGSNVSFINSALYDTVATVFNLRPAYEGPNCKCPTCENKRTNAEGTIPPMENIYTFKSSSFYCGDNPFFSFKEMPYSLHNGQPCFLLLDVNVTDSSAFSVGNWFENATGTEVADTEVELNIELGTKLKTQQIPATTGCFTVKYLNKDGKEATDYINGNSGDPDFPYQLGKQSFSITWCNTDGTELATVEYVDGATPIYTAVEPSEKFIVNGSEVLVNVHTGWAKEKNATAPCEISPLSEDVTYYAVFELMAPALVEYNSDKSQILDAYLKSEISSELISNLADGSVLLAFTDLTVTRAECITPNKNLTLDLSGYTLTLLTENGESASLGMPALDLTFTIRNGRIYSEGAPAIVSQKGNGNEEKGSIELHGIELKSLYSSAVRLECGKLFFFGGAVNVSTMSDFPAFIVGASGTECTLELYGINADVKNPKYTADLIRAESSEPTAEEAKINIVFGKHDGIAPVLNLGGNAVTAYAPGKNLALTLTVKDFDFSYVERLVGYTDFNARKAGALVSLSGDGAAIAPVLSGTKVVDTAGRAIITSADGKKLSAKEANVLIYSSLTVWQDLSVTLYVPVNSDVDLIKVVDKTVFDRENASGIPTVIKDGKECYKLLCREISAVSAVNDVKMKFFISDGSYLDVGYNVVEYCREIVEGEYSAEAKALSLAVLDYVKCSSEYFNGKNPEYQDGLKEAEAILQNYTQSEIPNRQINLDELSGLLRSVRYKLSEKPVLVITLEDGALGVPIEIFCDRGLISCFKNGVQSNTLELPVSFFDLNSPITLCIGEKEASFDFAAYAAACKEEAALPVNNLLRAMYNLGVAAAEYRESEYSSALPNLNITD